MQQDCGPADPLRPLLAALPNGALLLLDRLNCGGSFLLPLLVRAALQDGHKVVVLAAGHSAARHSAALRKLGVVQQAGAVAFVSLQQQQQQQQQQPPPERACRGVTLVLDSVPALLSLFPGAQAAAAFLHGCRALGPHLAAPGYRFAALAAADAPGEAPLLAALQHAADAVLALTPVEGRTADLDGRLDATLRRLPAAWADAAASTSGGGSDAAAAAARTTGSGGGGAWLPGMRSWHYRVTDVAVRWLPGQIAGRELMA
ncbi:MAG: hypothetical protein J3K34DRAFT_524148 [Monoraphidium minutum]|nr:MAG: hypothetical protein J3K34DRAFT_524148 [Monoraphidium minutum]